MEEVFEITNIKEVKEVEKSLVNLSEKILKDNIVSFIKGNLNIKIGDEFFEINYKVNRVMEIPTTINELKNGEPIILKDYQEEKSIPFTTSYSPLDKSTRKSFESSKKRNKKIEKFLEENNKKFEKFGIFS